MCVYASKIKACLLVLLGSGLGALFLTSMLGIWGPSSILNQAVGGLLTLLTFSGILRLVFVIASPSPLLIIEREGIRMEPALFGDQLIPWSYVRSVRYRKVRIGFGPVPWAPQHYLSLTVMNAERFRQRQGLIQRLLAYAWRASYMARGEVLLNSGLTVIPIERIYAEITTHTRQ